MHLVDRSTKTRERSTGRAPRGKEDPLISLRAEHRFTPPPASPRTAEAIRCFGLPTAQDPFVIADNARIRIEPGRIALLLGPSGSGKSSALRKIAEQYCHATTVQHITFPGNAAIIDRVAPQAAFADAAATLTACGLGDAHLWVRPFHSLSEGEQFRARLARSVAAHAPTGGTEPLLCDEFCSGLHRRAAKAISFNLRKLATRRGLSLVVASSNDDVVADLQPDTIVHFPGDGSAFVEKRTAPRPRPFSLLRRMRIEPGRKREYDAFAAMHYRATDELGFVDKVFVLREAGGDPLGIVVYSHPPMELALRNRATASRFSRDPAALNSSVRILRRLVIHSDLRGCGVGHHLVRATLPLVGTEYVECLASMGVFNPVFEKAGMERIGQCEQPAACRRAIAELEAIGIDPAATDFLVQVHRQRRVREIVARVVHNWYQATTGGGEARVARQSPEFLAQISRGLIGSRPVYYLWRRNTVRRARATRSEEPLPDGRGSVRRSARRSSPNRPARRREPKCPRRAAGKQVPTN